MSESSGSRQWPWSQWTTQAKVIGGVAVAATAVAVTSLWYITRAKQIPSRPTVERTETVCRDASLFPTLVQISEVSNDVREAFQLSKHELEKVASGMADCMKAGLEARGGSSLKMLPTYVDKMKVMARGQEVLALDMGGTNLRVMRVQLNPGGNVSVLSSTKHEIPKTLMIGSGDALFDFIATSVIEAVDDVENADEMPLGFTFSFPTDQDAIDSGRLVEWTKGFAASGVEGQNVAGLLNAAFQRMGRKFKVTALVNDTVGTMLTGAYETQDENTVIGLILGTGSNACYMEEAQKIVKWQGEKPISTGRMVINTEWGNFDSPVFRVLPHTKYDVEIDEASLNPKRQHFEKMISGMYLGEIVRLVLVSYCADINLFGGQTCSNLAHPYKFATHFMSQIEFDNSPDLAGVAAVLKSIGIQHSTVPVRQFVKFVCHLVASRSARLSAAGIAAILQQLDAAEKDVNVAIDGSLFELYPGYQDKMRAALLELGYARVTLTLAKDGSGVGAALTAAIMGQP